MERHVTTLPHSKNKKEIKETEWFDVSRIDALMAIWEGSGFEEIFSHGESEQIPAEPGPS